MYGRIPGSETVNVKVKEKAVPWVNALTLYNVLTLQQDGAPAHTAKVVQAWCRGASLFSGIRKCDPLFHLTLISWTLGYGPYWSRELAQSLI